MSTIERHNDSNADWPTAILAYLRFMSADLASIPMVGLQKLLQHAFSIEGARALAATAKFARSNTSTIQLRKDLLDTEEDRVRGHYSSLGETLEVIAKQKFHNVLSEVNLLVSYLEAAEVYTAFEDELLDETSEQYADFCGTMQDGTPQTASHRRQYILTQAVCGVFGDDKQLAKERYGKMEKYLKIALTLFSLSAVFGPGIHALLVSSA